MSEKAEFPLYYSGPIRDAPPLPTKILMNEIRLVQQECLEADKQCTAPYDWAPGGCEYEKMMRESNGVAEYNQLLSKSSTRDGGETCKAGSGLLLGDRLEREAEEDSETTTAHLLGRVCGDRQLVHEGARC